MASSPWWFKSNHHNCSLTSSQPPVHWLIYIISSCQLSSAFTSLVIRLWVNFESIFPVSLLPILSTSSPPGPFIIFMGKNSSAFCVSLQAAKRILRKNCIIWQITSIHNHLLKLGSTLPGDLLCFSRFVHFPHTCKHHFKSLFISSNLLAFSLSYWLFSENTETNWWKQPQLPANKSWN